jgi:acyl-CoA synthetase (AMP-forming)/AMP-acid ligase II/acyl carrier protein
LAPLRDASVVDLVTRPPAPPGDGPVLLEPDRPSLTRAELAGAVAGVAGAIDAAGISRGDPVALAVPNGQRLAVTLLGTMAAAIAAPLDPRQPPEALRDDLVRVGARLLLVSHADDPAAASATTAAARAGVGVLAVDGVLGIGAAGAAGAPGAPGAFEGPAGLGGRPRPDDVALLLSTSGTTSRPKGVPLTHANLVASAVNVARTLGLRQDDRALNVMPLVHIHGIVAGLLASLAAGSSVVCAPGFEAPRVLAWIEELGVTWYTAVPTMHQALVERAHRSGTSGWAGRLRFIRSSSASLAPTVLADLESLFGCPVIEAYGMTEAAHQMCSNPLPPAVRKPGSVGRPAGPEVAVMGPGDRLLGPGEDGEVVIRGANVMGGYRENPAANATAFVHGWFRTGDQGRFDADGYLTLTGRLKEIINRGGEKVAPREIDEVLLEHPRVAQAVAFAVPDRRLGEQVAAAVVVRPGPDLPERELRGFVAERLAPYKVPRRIVVLDELPKGPTGKLQRIGLAARLGIDELDARREPTTPAPPSTEVERLLAGMWSEVMGTVVDDVHAHFLDLGGDSLQATRLLGRLRAELDLAVSMLDFFDAPTVAEQARVIEDVLLSGSPGDVP